MSDIDNWCTDEVVCPACGFTYGDSYEFFRDNAHHAEIDCEKCGASFIADAEYSVTYTTRLTRAAAGTTEGEGETP